MAARYEPVGMSSKIYDELLGILRQSFKDACVLYIDRLVNPTLEEAFNKRKAAFTEAGVGAELRLFHGTTAEAVGSICSTGYKAAYNKTAAYGPGTYFSSAGSYSKNYANVTGLGESFMLVNRVLLGKNSVSVGAKYAGDSGGDGHTIYVTKHDDAALPEYVICFHKGARL